jgi:hypothetical protein
MAESYLKSIAREHEVLRSQLNSLQSKSRQTFKVNKFDLSLAEECEPLFEEFLDAKKAYKSSITFNLLFVLNLK